MTQPFNNASFRTQAWESDLQLKGDQFRLGAMQHGVGALQRGAEFAVQAGQQDQALQMRKAETDARVMLMEQERQENAYKLNMMHAVDGVKRGREEWRAMQLQNDILEIQRNRERKTYEEMDENAADKKMQRWMQFLGDPADAANSDIVIGGGDGQPMTLEFDPDRAKTIRERALTGGGREARYQRNDLRQMIDNEIGQLQDRIDEGMFEGGAEGQRALKARLSELLAHRQRLTDQSLEASGMAGDPGTPAPKPAPKKTPAAVSDIPDEKRQDLVRRLENGNMNRILNGISGQGSMVDPGAIADALWAQRDAIRGEWRKHNVGDRARKDLTDDQIDQKVMRILNSSRPEDQQLRQAWLTWLHGKQQGEK